MAQRQTKIGILIFLVICNASVVWGQECVCTNCQEADCGGTKTECVYPEVCLDGDCLSINPELYDCYCQSELCQLDIYDASILVNCSADVPSYIPCSLGVPDPDQCACVNDGTIPSLASSSESSATSTSAQSSTSFSSSKLTYLSTSEESASIQSSVSVSSSKPTYLSTTEDSASTQSLASVSSTKATYLSTSEDSTSSTSTSTTTTPECPICGFREEPDSCGYIQCEGSNIGHTFSCPHESCFSEDTCLCTSDTGGVTSSPDCPGCGFAPGPDECGYTQCAEGTNMGQEYSCPLGTCYNSETCLCTSDTGGVTSSPDCPGCGFTPGPNECGYTQCDTGSTYYCPGLFCFDPDTCWCL